MTAIFVNFLFVLLVTWFRFRDEISEAREARRINEVNELKTELKKAKARLKLRSPRTYTNRQGTRGMKHHADGRWTRVGTNPPPTFSKPPPPPNPPPPTTTRVLK